MNRQNNNQNNNRNNNNNNAKSNNVASNLSPNALNNLLGIVSSKLGTSPQQLKSQLEQGKFDNALSGMSQNDTNQLMNALSNPQMANKILSSPQAQAIIKKLNES